MKRTRHTPEQMVARLREAEAELNAGQTIDQVCQKLGVSEQTFVMFLFSPGAEVVLSLVAAVQSQLGRMAVKAISVLPRFSKAYATSARAS